MAIGSARRDTLTSKFELRTCLAVSAFSVAGLVSCSIYNASLLAGSSLDVAGGGADAGSFGGVGIPDAAGQTSGGTDAGNSASSVAGEAGNSGLAGAAEVGGTDAGGAPSGGAGGGRAGTGETGGGGSGAGGSGAGGSSAGGSGAGGSGAGGSAQGGATATPVELAVGKAVQASSVQTGNEAPRGNDNNLATRWCAVDGSFPQWWRVDLGAVHPLSTFTVHFEHPDLQYSYQIETSQNDAVYAVQASLSGTGAAQSGSFPANVSARYVRITITDAVQGDAPHQPWGCFWEFSLTGS